jgi:aryl-alcohol dehydrogenase-like predicted oxidoreductase
MALRHRQKASQTDYETAHPARGGPFRCFYNSHLYITIRACGAAQTLLRRIVIDTTRGKFVSTVLGVATTARSGQPAMRRIGPSELTVFPLAISGNVFGWTAPVEATEAILDTYHDAGGNFVDTADSYAAGRSEIMIGNWMRDRRNRDEIVVATKVGKSANSPGLTRQAIVDSVTASLERLQTGWIDLLYLHIDDTTVPFDETLLAVDSLIAAGKVRYFGGSNHTGNRLIEARIASAQVGVAHMVALQNQYNLVERTEYEGDLARVADALDLGVMPRFALASGFLTGKYRTKADLARNDRGHEAAKYLNRRGLRIIAVLDEIARELEAPVAAVALAWLLTRPRVVAPVVSASRPAQVNELLQAVSLTLTRHHIAELDRVSA